MVTVFRQAARGRVTTQGPVQVCIFFIDIILLCNKVQSLPVGVHESNVRKPVFNNGLQMYRADEAASDNQQFHFQYSPLHYIVIRPTARWDNDRRRSGLY